MPLINFMEYHMRRLVQLSMLCFVAGVAGACSPDEVVTTENIPTAGVRFINAVPDTGVVDFRFIDALENLPTFLAVPFRASSGMYQPVSPGTRPVRVFVNSNDPVAAQRMLIDTTITLTAGARYTMIRGACARKNPGDYVCVRSPRRVHCVRLAWSRVAAGLGMALSTGVPTDDYPLPFRPQL